VKFQQFYLKKRDPHDLKTAILDLLTHEVVLCAPLRRMQCYGVCTGRKNRVDGAEEAVAAMM
jgi:hypothetical protein